MDALRSLVLASTFVAIIFLAAHRNPPPRMVETPYCVVDKRVASKEYAQKRDRSPLLDAEGKPVWRWNFQWGTMYAPCNQQDRFVDA